MTIPRRQQASKIDAQSSWFPIWTARTLPDWKLSIFDSKSRACPSICANVRTTSPAVLKIAGESPFRARISSHRSSKTSPGFIACVNCRGGYIRRSFSDMKAGIHPEYHETDMVCACGAVYHTRSTRRDIRIGICAACHPFFTGEQKFVDTAGRVEKFAKRYGSTKAARSGKKG
jgi:large subunit ribosomal protein L31